MTIQDFAAAFVHMADDTPVTLTIRAGDLRDAVEMASGGPEIMSTAQAAKVFGWNPKRWRGWAKQGWVPGAYQEANGDWRLPRDGCRQRRDEEAAAGRRAPKRAPADGRPGHVHVHALAPGPANPTTGQTIRRRPRRRPRREAA